MGNKNYHFDTKRIHAGYSAEEHLNAVNTPIYQTEHLILEILTGQEDCGPEVKTEVFTPESEIPQ